VAGAGVLNGHTHMLISRYNPDGTPDMTFGANQDGHALIVFDPNKDDAARAVTLEPDGKIVVAGYANNPNTNQKTFALARLNTDGHLDLGFDGGSGKNDGRDLAPFGGGSEAFGLAIQKDGAIVAAGSGTFLGIQGFQVERFDPAHGQFDLNFGNNKTGGTLIGLGAGNSAAHAVALTPDGKIVLAGYALDNGKEDFALAEFEGTGPNAGKLDMNFGNGGEVLTPSGKAGADAVANAVTVQADGKIVAAGGILNGAAHFFLVTRYDTQGNLDQGFGDGGRTAVNFGLLAASSGDSANAVNIDADGNLVAAGVTGPSGSETFGLLRLTPDGKPDLTFGFLGKAETSFAGTMDATATGVGFSPDGKIVLAGRADSDIAVARYENDKLQFGAPVFAGSEDGGTTTVTVTRTGGSSGVVSAQIGVTGGTALAGVDYVFATPQVATFADGVTTQTVTIPLVRSVFVDGAKTIQLGLYSAKGASLGTQATATVVVADAVASPVQDVTPLVKVTPGKVKRGRGGRFLQKVTLVNVGGQALFGPLTLVLTGLRKPVRFLSASGVTHALGMPGSPYLVLDGGAGPFQAGESRTVVLLFRSPSRKKIVYTPHVLAGSACLESPSGCLCPTSILQHQDRRTEAPYHASSTRPRGRSPTRAGASGRCGSRLPPSRKSRGTRSAGSIACIIPTCRLVASAPGGGG
jgi:uncharacterized delta-60 repeat protein